MSLDLSSFDPLVKDHYTSEKVESLIYKKNPFFALVKKYEKAGGRQYVQPLIYGTAQNPSANFTIAQASDASGLSEAFEVPYIRDYAIAKIDTLTIEATKGDKNAFMDAMTAEVDRNLESLALSVSRRLYRSRWGSIGTIATNGISSATITLATKSDVYNFGKGQKVQFAASESSDTLRNSGGTLTVSRIDRENGTVTFTAAVSTLNAVAAGDVIFSYGDRHDSATPTARCMTGLIDYMPDSTPTDSLHSVDRSSDPELLGGFRLDASTSGKSLEEILIDGANLVGAVDGGLTHYFMSPRQYASLVKSLGSKVQYVDQDMGTVGFRGVQVHGPYGDITCMPDRNCQDDHIWGVDIDAWTLVTVGKTIKTIDSDGNMMLRQASEDGVEVRLAFFGNLVCKAPGRNINIKVAVPA